MIKTGVFYLQRTIDGTYYFCLCKNCVCLTFIHSNYLPNTIRTITCEFFILLIREKTDNGAHIQLKDRERYCTDKVKKINSLSLKQNELNSRFK